MAPFACHTADQSGCVLHIVVRIQLLLHLASRGEAGQCNYVGFSGDEDWIELPAALETRREMVRACVSACVRPALPAVALNTLSTWLQVRNLGTYRAIVRSQRESPNTRFLVLQLLAVRSYTLLPTLYGRGVHACPLRSSMRDAARCNRCSPIKDARRWTTCWPCGAITASRSLCA
jgi:hypothetical protein